jgi:hypothetical protein
MGLSLEETQARGVQVWRFLEESARLSRSACLDWAMEYDMQRAEVMRLMRGRNHWKANHDQQVAFKRVTAQKRDEFKAERDEARRLLRASTKVHQFDMLRVKPYWRHRKDCVVCAIDAFLARPEAPWCQSQAEEVEHADGKYPSRRGKCSLCGREGPVNDSGRTFRHRRIAP